MLESILTSEINLVSFGLCSLVSILLGVGAALVFQYRDRSSQGFVVTLAILPLMVQTVIMLVNGNLGAGVAVAGAFSLVRFRSASGSAREIGAVFLVMTIGLATGMGYLLLAVLFFALAAVLLLVLMRVNFGRRAACERELKITIPENLDYDGLFDDLFERYTDGAELERVKTASMGTLYELDYLVRLKSPEISREFLDALRCRNGNLNIVCGKIAWKEVL